MTVTSLSATADATAPPPCPPGFTVAGELGRGRQGVVYRVRRGGREYALKVLAPDETGSALGALRREAAKLATIRHPGVPVVHEIGTTGDRPYLVMDVLEGRPLTEVLSAGVLPTDTLLRVAAGVASALVAAHRSDLVHGDLTPANILLGDDGSIGLIDFSLGAQLTADGTDRVAGSALYCSPELGGMLHRAVDGRTDLYSLGVILFEAATGATPFAAADLGELLRQHAVAPVPDLRAAAPHLPAAFAATVQRLLAKDPDDRHRTAAGLLRDLAVPPAEVFAGRDAEQAAEVFAGRDAEQAAEVFAGRDAELDELGVRWAQTFQGKGGLVMVTGGSGIGKSRLVRELARDVPPGCPVLYGAGAHGEKQPMAPLRAAVDGYLRELSRRPDGAALDLVREAAGDTAGVISELSETLAGIFDAPALAGTDVDEERYTAAVAGFLVELARRTGGLLLHLDDVQWFDRTTVRVLEQLATAADRAPLLVVLTAREDGADAAPVAAVRGLLGERLTTMVLPPLDVASAGALVTALNGGLTISGELAARLATRSRGNPFVLAEYVRAVINAGVVTVSWGEWLVDPAALDVLTLPQDVSDLVRRRVDELDTRNRLLLGIAATAGYQFRAGLLAELGELSHRAVTTLLAGAARLGLVEQREDGSYGFLHERIREALADQFDGDSRQRLHDRIADVLSRHASPAAPDVYALAHHRMHGTPGHDPAAAIAACRAAGVLALAEHAPETAVTFLEHAATVAAVSGVAPDDRFGELLAGAYHRSTRLDDAAATLRATLEQTADPLRRARLLYRLSEVHQSAWNTEEQISAGEQALAELGRRLPRGDVSRVASSVGYFLLAVVIWVTRIGHHTRNPRARERYLLECSIHESLGAAYVRELQPAKAVIFALRAPYLACRTGRTVEGVRSLSSVALLLEFTGMSGLASRLSAKVARDAAALHDRPLVARVAWSRAVGRHGGGADDGTDVHRMLDEHDRWLDFGLALDAYAVVSWDWVLRGDMATAEAGLDRARRRAVSSGQGGRSGVVAADACLLALRGRAGEAALLLNTIDGTDLPLHQWVDLLIGRLQTAVERGDSGADYERAMAAFDAYGLGPRDLLPAQHTFYCLRAYAELDRLRAATEQNRPQRLAAARAAVTTLGRVAHRPILRAYHRVGEAALAVLAGAPEKALTRLAAAAGDLRAVDAPLVEYEAARVQAYAMIDLGLPQHARRQAAFALSLAHAQGWPHRAQRMIAEFGLDGLEGADARAGVAGHRDGQRWAALQQVSLAASRVLDPAQLARIALDEVIRILGAERAFLLLEPDAATGLGRHVGRDAHGRDVAELRGYSTSIVDRVRAQRRAVVVTGNEEGEVLRSDSMIRYGLRSILAGPIVLDDRLLGVVYLDSRLAKGVFTAADLEILTAVTHQIAISLETARAAQLEVAVATAHHQRDLAEMLREAMAAFAATLDPEDVLDRLMTAVRQAGAAEQAVLVTAGDDNAATLRYRDGDTTRRLVVPGTAALLEGNAAALAQELPDGVVPRDGRQLIPLTIRDNRLGVLVLADAPPTARTADPQVIAALVGQAMTAYENALLFAQVQQLATVDPLTGVANRRSFFERAQREFATVAERPDGIAVLMLDVDHFKKINDGYGHQVGDEVLRGVVTRLRTGRRPADLLARYGGEEFVLLLPGDGACAAAIAEQIRAEVARAPIDTSAGPVPVTISVGAARATAPGSLDAVLGRADACLYEAKRSGRNRVVAADRAEKD
ncbi:diguanylate cyclase [Actinoplanes sp. GCM10030250]|uniref:diguanylate cyclase n=1 Tax=Actinoplanes sp. GCM10030250 TaxID=3273376 RepID=UPI003611BF69